MKEKQKTPSQRVLESWRKQASMKDYNDKEVITRPFNRALAAILRDLDVPQHLWRRH